MIEAMVHRIVDYIDKYDDSKRVSRPVMVFALQSLLNNVLTFILCLLIGWWTGKFAEVCVVLAGTVALRILAGGLHFVSPGVCIIVTTLVVTSIPFIPVNHTVSLILNAVSAVLVLAFAPADLKGKTRISDRGLQIRKFAGLLLVCANFVIQSPLLSLAFLGVAITLIPWKGGKKHA